MADKAIHAGGQPVQPAKTCGTCHGRKTVDIKSHTAAGVETKNVTCPACRGTGQGSGLMTK